MLAIENNQRLPFLKDRRGNRSSLNATLSLIALLICLVPVLVKSSDGDGISANYLYALLIPVVVGFKFRLNNHALFFVTLFCVAFFLSIPINYISLGLSADHFNRQFISLIIFLLPFILLHINLESIELKLFRAIILASVIYSIFVLYNFTVYVVGNGINPFMIKDALGNIIPDWPQRYVLVLFAGFFLSFDDRFSQKFSAIFRLIIFFVIVVTFLRAAYLALGVGFLFYLYLRASFKNTEIFRLKSIIFILAVSLICFYVFNSNDDLLGAALTIGNYFLDSAMSLLSGDGADNVSDQTRIDILSTALLQINPITGLGGGGIYFILPDIGSSHNQFLDFYVRFGLFGLISYLYFNYRIVSFFSKTKPWVVGLVITYLVFGVAHETTKYSYGSFIFFSLLSLTYQSKRQNSSNSTMEFSCDRKNSL